MIDLISKQTQAFDVLVEPEYSHVIELLYGGGAGGGKSILGCVWLINQCLKYKGTRWLMGRKALKTLKETTLNSFFWIATKGGVKYRYIENKGISFPNGSEILLKDLDYYPSDPEYSELGSLEITGAFVDECNQITEKCWNIVKSRIRYSLDEYGLTPKILGTCNPDRNWVYNRFYEPYIRGTLDTEKMFIQSLVDDNDKISKHYAANLDGLDEMSRERLRNGNWEYMDISNLWAYAFRRERHLGKCSLNRSESVFLSFDFNRNPIVCSVYQHYDNTIYCLEIISIQDATIYRLCDEIKARYDGCYFFVTGDISGKTKTTLSQFNNFDVIKAYFRLGKNQMQYSGANPPLAENRVLVNAMLEQYNIVFDKDKCEELIFDFQNVKSDAEGKPVKKDRKDEAQRADCLDTFRYYLNRYFSDFIKFFVR
jgi:phage terminase large subunit